MGTGSPPVPDYNPLGLPDRTIRIQMSSSSDQPRLIFTSRQGSSLSFTKVSGTDTQWDCHLDSDTWYNLFSLHTDYDEYKLVKVLGANTSTVTNMYNMFWAGDNHRHTRLSEIALFDTSNVTNMSSMFKGCSGLSGVPAFDTSKVRNMGTMFEGTSITSIPNFDTSSVTYIAGMFKDCTSLREISLPNTFVFKANAPVYEMFSGCKLVSGGIVNAYNAMIAANVGSHANTFKDCGIYTDTGTAELSQIPSSWGGTAATS